MCDVLIVDDDFMVARSHKRIVELLGGFTVVGVAHTASEALGMIGRFRPQLVLLDIYLPDRPGLDVIRQCRQSGIDVDFLVLSAAREADMVGAAMQGGVVSYLIKPFKIDELRLRLAAYSERRRLLGVDGDLDQVNVDRAMGSPSREATALPKGMSAETARLIADVLATTATGLSAAECATLVGISRVAARKYLEYFADTGSVTVQLRYGQTGRPQRRYSWSQSRALADQPDS